LFIDINLKYPGRSAAIILCVLLLSFSEGCTSGSKVLQNPTESNSVKSNEVKKLSESITNNITETTDIPIQGKVVPELSEFDNQVITFMNKNHIQAGMLAIMKNGKLVLQKTGQLKVFSLKLWKVCNKIGLPNKSANAIILGK